MGGRGLGQPAGGREGIIRTSTCGEGTASAGREGIIRTSTCDGEGEGTASREGRYNRDHAAHVMGRGRGKPAAGREGIIGTSTCDGEGDSGGQGVYGGACEGEIFT